MEPGYAQQQGAGGGFTINWPDSGNAGTEGGGIFNQAGDDDDDDDLYS